MGGLCLEGHITDTMNTRMEDTSRIQRMEEMSRRQRRIQASSERGQGPEGNVVP